MLLFSGCIVLSHVQNELRYVMSNVKELTGEIDDKEQLDLFFGVLKHYNHRRSLDPTLVNQISEFMEIKWKTDKNNFLLTE